MWTNTGHSRSGQDGKAQEEPTLGLQICQHKWGSRGSHSTPQLELLHLVAATPKRRDQTYTQNGMTAEGEL